MGAVLRLPNPIDVAEQLLREWRPGGEVHLSVHPNGHWELYIGDPGEIIPGGFWGFYETDGPPTEYEAERVADILISQVKEDCQLALFWGRVDP